MTNSEELLNKKLTDIAKSNPSGNMWFIKAPSWEGWTLGDEENSGNFSYWHLYDEDDNHKGTISVEDGIITQLPRDLMERKMTNEQLRMQMLSGIITEGEYKTKLQENAATAVGEKVEAAVEDKLEAKVDALSDQQKEQLRAELAKLGITADTKIEDAAKKLDESLLEGNGDIKSKVANVLQGIGTGLIGSLLAPLIPMAIGDLDPVNIGMSGGLAITAAVGGGLIGLAKLLNIKKTQESLNENFVGIGAINSPFAQRGKADYEMAFEHFLGERYLQNFDNPNQNLKEDDNAKRKDDLVKLIATGERQLADLKQMKDKISASSIVKAEKAIDMLKDALKGTNEGKEESLYENNGMNVVANILGMIKNGNGDEEIIAYMMDNNFESEEQAREQLLLLKGALDKMKQAINPAPSRFQSQLAAMRDKYSR
jgi:hypothetical protein